MNTKFDVNDEVNIGGVIDGIVITEKGALYKILIPCFDDMRQTKLIAGWFTENVIAKEFEEDKANGE